MRKKMRYLPGPVDLKKAEKKQWVKVGLQKVEKKQWVKVTSTKLKKNNVEKEGPPKVEKKQWVKEGIYSYILTYIYIYISIYTLVKPYMGIYVYGDGGGVRGGGASPRPRHPHMHISPYMASPGYIWICIYINMLIYSYIYPLLPIVFFQLFRVCKGL